MILVLHYEMAHLGQNKLLSLIAEHVWHPSVSKVAADVTQKCVSCQKMKVSPTIQPPITKIVTASPFDLVAVDLIALSLTHKRNVGCLVLVDHNSKWMSAQPIASKHADAVMNALKLMLPYLPKVSTQLLSDNGPEFLSAVFNELLGEVGIQHVYTTPFKVASRGLVERCNQTLAELLRNLSASAGSWDEFLPRAIMICNSTVHSKINLSPSEYLLTKKHSMTRNPVVPAEVVEHWHECNPSFVLYLYQRVSRKVVFKSHLLVDKLKELSWTIYLPKSILIK